MGQVIKKCDKNFGPGFLTEGQKSWGELKNKTTNKNNYTYYPTVESKYV